MNDHPTEEQPAASFAGSSRRQRMIRLILSHPEVDQAGTHGTLVFRFYDDQYGQPEVRWRYVPDMERIP